MKHVGIVIIILFALFLTGCGQTASETLLEESMEAAMGGGDVEVEMKDGETQSVTIETEDGEVSFSTGGADLPQGYPEEIPYYDGEITNSGTSSVESLGFTSYSMTIETNDNSEDIVAFYVKELSKDDWSKILEVNDPESGTSTLSWLKNAMDQVNVSILAEDKVTEITQTVVIEMIE
jgi:hypothetical protein